MHYRAIREDGTIVEGQLTAGSRQEAVRQLERDGLRPISVADDAPSKAAPGAGWRLGGAGRRVPQHIVEEFMRQLSRSEEHTSELQSQR